MHPNIAAALALPPMPTTRDAILLHLRHGVARVPSEAVGAVRGLVGEGLVIYRLGDACLSDAGQRVAGRLAHPEPVGSWGEAVPS